MNTQKLQNPDAPMPKLLKRVSAGTSVTLIALALAIAWWWFPESAVAKLISLVLFVLAAPPITTIAVLEVANRVTAGELKRTGKLQP